MGRYNLYLTGYTGGPVASFNRFPNFFPEDRWGESGPVADRLYGTGLRNGVANNCRMLRQLQCRADDLAECLLISELEMRRSRTLEGKLAAYRDFSRVVDMIDVLRMDVEELIHSDAKESMLVDLDRKVSTVRRSPSYRIVEWFHLYADVGWFVGPAMIDPVRHTTQC